MDVDGIFIHHHDPGFSYLNDNNDTNNEMELFSPTSGEKGYDSRPQR